MNLTPLNRRSMLRLGAASGAGTLGAAALGAATLPLLGDPLGDQADALKHRRRAIRSRQTIPATA